LAGTKGQVIALDQTAKRRFFAIHFGNFGLLATLIPRASIERPTDTLN